MAKNNKLEDTFQQLDQILEQLEDNDISLEDTFQLYQQGVTLIKEGNDSIDRVEKQLMILEESNQ